MVSDQNNMPIIYRSTYVCNLNRFEKYTDGSSSKSICVKIALLSDVTSVLKKPVCVLLKIYLNISYIDLSTYVCSLYRLEKYIDSSSSKSICVLK